MKHVWEKLALIMLVVVFGSGLLIWGYNKLQGNDLSDPPDFDLSAYDELSWPSVAEVGQVFFDDGGDDAASSEADLVAALAEKIRINEAVALEPTAVYFSSYFRGDTWAETQRNIASFLDDFEPLQGATIVDIVADTCFDVHVDLEGRLDTLESLRKDTSIVSVDSVPEHGDIFTVCFDQPYYTSEIDSLFASYDAITVQPRPRPIQEYIAYTSYATDDAALRATVELFKKDFSDILLVTE